MIMCPTLLADTGPATPAFSTANPSSAWRLSLDVRRDQREFKSGDTAERILVLNTFARASVDATPWLSLSGIAGAVQAERDTRDGQWGPLFGVAATAYLTEFVLHQTPTAGKKRVFGLEADLSHLYRESNFTDTEFTWNETRLLTSLVYRENKPNDREWLQHTPRGLQMRAGLLFLNTDGELATDDVEANRNFGLHLGSAWVWERWTTRLYGNVLGGKEYEWGIGSTFHF